MKNWLPLVFGPAETVVLESKKGESIISTLRRRTICHTQCSRLRMFMNKILIIKLWSIHTSASCAISTGSISALYHKAWNESMHGAALVVGLQKVSNRLGDGAVIKCQVQRPQSLFTVVQCQKGFHIRNRRRSLIRVDSIEQLWLLFRCAASSCFLLLLGLLQ